MPNGYPIPQTPALQRVSRHSLQELFSRDPETYSKSDLDEIILQIRDLRDRLATSTGDGKVRQVRVAAPTVQGVGDPDALGL